MVSDSVKIFASFQFNYSITTYPKICWLKNQNNIKQKAGDVPRETKTEEIKTIFQNSLFSNTFEANEILEPHITKCRLVRLLTFLHEGRRTRPAVEENTETESTSWCSLVGTTSAATAHSPPLTPRPSDDSFNCQTKWTNALVHYQTLPAKPSIDDRQNLIPKLHCLFWECLL